MVELLATPLLRATGTPKFWPVIWNWTDPVGVALPEVGLTVAVKNTPWPNTDGLAEEATAVVVPVAGCGLTTCVRGGLVLVRKLPSPL